MRAVQIHEYGDSAVLRYEAVAHPEIGVDEVLIRTVAAGVNPADWKIRNGLFQARRPLRFPHILGTEVSGVVEAVGPLVTRFQPGDPVFARVENAHAEYVAAKTDAIAAAPRSIPLTHAAALPVAAGVAWLVLFDTARLRHGQRILIHGGAGNVGRFAIQLAKAAGAMVFTTARSENAPRLEALGADLVIDPRNEDFAEAAVAMDVVFDAVGGETQARLFAALRQGGLLVSIVAPPDSSLAERHGVRTHFGRRDLNGAILEELARHVDAGHLQIFIDSMWPLSEAAAAHRRLEAGGLAGKILLLA